MSFFLREKEVMWILGSGEDERSWKEWREGKCSSDVIDERRTYKIKLKKNMIAHISYSMIKIVKFCHSDKIPDIQ